MLKQGEYGSVRYIARAEVDISWGMDADSELEIFVSNLRDLNEEKETLEMSESQQVQVLV